MVQVVQMVQVERVVQVVQLVQVVRVAQLICFLKIYDFCGLHHQFIKKS